MRWTVEDFIAAAKRQEEEKVKNRLVEEEAAHAAKAAVSEKRRADWRDADRQSEPYEYRCIGHANLTLAMRYGIANVGMETVEYVYYGRDGQQLRNPERDRQRPKNHSTIRLRKLQSLDGDKFIAELPDFGGRRVRVVIARGTEYVSTFLPISDSWFDSHSDYESALKDNPTFSLKEIAHLHIEKTVKGAEGAFDRAPRLGEASARLQSSSRRRRQSPSKP